MATLSLPHIVPIALPPPSPPNETMQLLRIVCKNFLGKRYLLVLDGLFDAYIEWYFELGNDESESVFIVTTRLEEVAKTMVGEKGIGRLGIRKNFSK